MSATALHKLTAVTTAAAALATGRRLMKISIHGGSGNSSVEVKNAATDTGTGLYSAAAIIATSYSEDFTSVGGIDFSTGIFVKPAGTGCIVYVWTE